MMSVSGSKGKLAKKHSHKRDAPDMKRTILVNMNEKLCIDDHLHFTR